MYLEYEFSPKICLKSSLKRKCRSPLRQSDDNTLVVFDAQCTFKQTFIYAHHVLFFALTQHMFNVIIDNITSPTALMPNFWLVSRLSVCHNFQNGREATLPYHTHYHCRLLITGQPQLCRLPGPDG